MRCKGRRKEGTKWEDSLQQPPLCRRAAIVGNSPGGGIPKRPSVSGSATAGGSSSGRRPTFSLTDDSGAVSDPLTHIYGPKSKSALSGGSTATASLNNNNSSAARAVARTMAAAGMSGTQPYSTAAPIPGL